MHSLTAGNVTSPKEGRYFIIALVISIPLWAVLTLLTLGFVWIALLFIGILLWFTNGLLVAGLKSNAVAVHPHQLSRLDASFCGVCETLGVASRPGLYVIQSGGLLNAFATRHSGRHFVVVYSEMLESLGTDSREMKFLLGHEIGHIRRNHLFRRLLLAPALFLPLIGAAYSRSCESTCDRFGVLAAGDVGASLRAMMTLAGGKEAAQEMDPDHFAEQNRKHRGFFVSLYELVSGYPTLSRRVKDMWELEPGRESVAASRNPIAYLFALFMFGGGFGGRGSIMTTVIMIYFAAIFSAIAIPAVSGAMKKAQAAQKQSIRPQITR